jgi:hypothetical protein
MSRLPVTESSKGHKVSATLISGKIERNKLMSWDSTFHELNKPVSEFPRPKTPVTPGPLGFVSNITKSIYASLVKLPYTLLKLGYEMAKLFTRGLSSFRRLLSS